ncbi:MAG: hypothetical protein ABIK86_08375 [candidate division WOR-3 bacterium]
MVRSDRASRTWPFALRHNPPDNYVYCANWGGGNVRSDSVLAFDVATASIAARVGVGRGPSSLVYNPIDNRVYTTDFYGATVSILRASGGVEEKPRIESRTPSRSPAIVRGVLQMPKGANASSIPSWLLDVAGRRVMELFPGLNDVSRLGPGVYFVRQAQAQVQAYPMRKMVISR